MKLFAGTAFALACLAAAAAPPRAGAQVPARPVSLLDGGRLDAAHESFLRGLFRSFTDPDPKRRRAAVEQVARAGNAAVPLLREQLRDSSDGIVQRSCLLALDAIGGEAAAAAVREAFLKRGLLDDEKALAALVLGKLEPGEALEALRAAAVDHRPSPLRTAAVFALGRSEDVEGLRATLGRVAKEPLELQRAAAVTAAGACGDRLLLPSVVLELRDRGRAARAAAAFAVGRIGDPAALPELLEQAERERDGRVRVALALSLGGFEDQGSLAVLQGFLRSHEAELRLAALTALAARADGAVATAAFFAGNRDPELMADVALACAEAPGSSLDQPLQQLLESPRPTVRAGAGLALAARGVRDAGDALVRWLGTEKNAAAQRDAVIAAGALVLPKALPAVRTFAGDDALRDETLRTLEGRRDARAARDRLEDRLRAGGARLADRRRRLVAELVDEAFGLGEIARKLPPDGGGGGGGGGDSDGGGSGEPDDGGGSGEEGQGPKKNPRFDLRGTSLERDLQEWFAKRPYFDQLR